ncbi:hypothetical protein [Polaribacter glomeratus]|uniref:DUF3575 domain-containing protein n=1 Tax=Polaribacter glomeratus TaxID=102 RepID=A0A2S7WFJ2_9FLAO|nr:hypothetical protein [Polaribacter glomeratus]PQJ76364.1 hypothetical protein BTO16_10640 [Polaribacter glomeratus]TXD65499.1 hypothetical protein ESX12_09945 [Polaribacter glomeratus]
MKKTILIITLLIGSFGFAQQEIKLDLADALIVKSLEFSYEKYLTDESSIGVSALFNLAKQSSDFRYNENTMITPYYRHYFTTNSQWNLFGEGFFGINSGKYEVTDEASQEISYEKYTDGALGVAVGTKYIATGGLTIDLYGGIGRNLFGTNSPVLVPRVGLNIGWRF